jgi:hypothetical protein
MHIFGSVILTNTLRALSSGTEARVGLDAVDGVLGEEPRGGPACVRGREYLGPVAVVPEVDAVGPMEAVGETLSWSSAAMERRLDASAVAEKGDESES